MIERLLHRVSAFMFAFLMVTAVFDGTQACATIYNEFSLGHGGRPGSGQFPISDAGWSAHFGPSATPVPVPARPNDAPANWEAGFVRNFEALATDGRHPSNPLRDGDVLLWTENLQQRVACEDVALLQFGQRNADAEIAPHPALRIDGQWYVTADPFPQQSIRLTAEPLRTSLWKRPCTSGWWQLACVGGTHLPNGVITV